MAIDKELIDKLLADYKGPEDLIGEQGLLKQLTKALVERAMQAEPTGSSTNSEVIIVRAKRVMMREHFQSQSGRLYDFCTIRANALEVIDSRRVKMVDLVGIEPRTSAQEFRISPSVTKTRPSF